MKWSLSFYTNVLKLLKGITLYFILLKVTLILKLKMHKDT